MVTDFRLFNKIEWTTFYFDSMVLLIQTKIQTLMIKILIQCDIFFIFPLVYVYPLV